VDLFLVWKTASGNLERRFRRVREIRCPERARLLEASVENCVLVEQAPPSKMLGTWQSSDQADENKKYLQHVLKLHTKLHGNAPTRMRHAERRDAGVPRKPASGGLGPETEAAFGRKREAAIADVVAASPSKRARMIRDAPRGLSRVAQEAAEESVQMPAAASASVVGQVAKRGGAAKERHLRGAEAAAKARAKREKKVVQSSTQPRQGRDADLLAPALKPGIMLVRLQDGAARRKAQQLRFQLTGDPLDFVAQVAQVAASKKKGHVVLAPPVDTDYSLSAMIAAALMGAFYATPEDFVRQVESPRGITYREKCKSSNHSFHVAVSAALADEFPTLPQVLRAVALAPGSCFKFYVSEHKLCKFFKTKKREGSTEASAEDLGSRQTGGDREEQIQRVVH